MFKSLALFAITALVLSAPYHSFANTEISKQYKEKLDTIKNSESVCMDKADTTVDMHDCLSKSHSELDALLNESYRTLRSAVKEDKVYFDALKTEQLAWIKLNKAIIDNVFKTGGGGSLDSINAGGISNHIFINRIELFISLLLAHE